MEEGSETSYLVQVLLDVRIAQGVVLQVPGEVLVIGSHVDESMTGEIEQDDTLLARLDALLRLVVGGGFGLFGFR